MLKRLLVMLAAVAFIGLGLVTATNVSANAAATSTTIAGCDSSWSSTGWARLCVGTNAYCVATGPKPDDGSRIGAKIYVTVHFQDTRTDGHYVKIQKWGPDAYQWSTIGETRDGAIHHDGNVFWFDRYDLIRLRLLRSDGVAQSVDAWRYILPAYGSFTGC